MSLRLLETGLAALIAAGYAGLGELVLRRRSAGLAELAESFLIGGALASSLLFPLSLLAPRRALGITAGILAMTLVLFLATRIGRRKETPVEGTVPTPAKRRALTPLELALSCVIAFSTLAFVALNWRYSYLWDGFQIWAARAQMLYYQGSLVPQLAEKDFMNGILNYPSLVPATESLVALLRGGFDFEALKPVFLFFYLAMVAGTYAAARAVAGRAAALAAVAVLCLLPGISAHSAAGGYADMPLAAVVAGLLSAHLRGNAVRGWRSPTAWLIGSLATVKQEGAVLAGICLAAAAATAILHRPRRGGRQWFSGASFLLPPALLLGLRVAYLRWIGVTDPLYGPLDRAHFLTAVARVPEVARLCGRELLSIGEWGLLWALCLPAAVYVLAVGSPAVRTVTAGTLVALCLYSAIFLFTNSPLSGHVAGAYPRLLAQLAPAGAVVLAAAYGAGSLARTG